MTEYKKGQTCQVTEKCGNEFYDCGVTAVAKAEAPDWYLCKGHVTFALCAGWEIEHLQEPSEEMKVMWAAQEKE